MPEGQGWAWNQGLLDVGARLCRPSEQVLDLLENKPTSFTKEDGEVVDAEEAAEVAELAEDRLLAAGAEAAEAVAIEYKTGTPQKLLGAS